MQKPFFDYAAATRQALEASGGDGDKDGNKKDGGKDKPRTLMVGEAPGEDLGYDPKSIPTEPIPPEEDDEDADKSTQD
jgi:hypothetical protein